MLRQLRNLPRFLVLGGGGGRAIYAIPVVECFEKMGLLNELEKIAVTSAGGLTGLALALGYNSAQMYEYIENYCLYGKFDRHLSFIPEHVATHQPSPYLTIHEKDASMIRLGKFFSNLSTYHYLVAKGIAHVFISEGLFDIQGIEESFWSIIKECPNLSHLTDNEKRTLTFRQLHELKSEYPNRKLIDISFITVEEVKSKVYQVHLCSYETTPDMPLLEAAVASSHLPTFFRKRKYGEKILWDGSIKKNLARELFDSPEYFSKKDRLTEMNMRTIAIYFATSQEEIEQKRDNIAPVGGSFWKQMTDYFDRLMVDSVIPIRELNLQDQEDKRDANPLRTIYLDTSKVSRITPYLTEKDILEIRQYAYHETEQFINNYFVNVIDPHISLNEIRQVTNSTKLWAYFRPSQNDFLAYQNICIQEKENAGNLGLPNEVINHIAAFSSFESLHNLRESCRFFGFNADIKKEIEIKQAISQSL